MIMNKSRDKKYIHLVLTKRWVKWVAIASLQVTRSNKMNCYKEANSVGNKASCSLDVGWPATVR